MTVRRFVVCSRQIAESKRLIWQLETRNRTLFVYQRKVLCVDPSQAPLLFAIGLFVLPNTLDFVDMAHFLNRLKNNPYVILNAILWWFIFFPAIIWAKK